MRIDSRLPLGIATRSAIVSGAPRMADSSVNTRDGVTTVDAVARSRGNRKVCTPFPDKAMSARAVTAAGAQTAAVTCAGAVPGPAGSALAAAGGVQVWLTTVDQANLLTRQPDISSQPAAGPAKGAYDIAVDVSKKYQQMDGFGASITDASASLLQRRLTGEQRAAVIQDLFGQDGLHVSMVRQPMGSCDYNINLFTYDDDDDTLKDFSIDADKRFMIPTLKEALQVNPALKVVASPWSAPPAMKDSGSIIAGSLDPKCYKVYGEYFARFVEAYRDLGIHIYAITPQNEPLYVPHNYPGMSMTAREQAAFIKRGLGPALRSHGLDTKLLIYDHNMDRPDYPLDVLNDPEASQYVDGVAWHGYGGEHKAMSAVHDAFPDKGTWFTEDSGGDWIPAFHDAFMDQMKNVVRVPRNWSKSLIWWNLALDTEKGPSLLGDWSTCRGLITVNATTGDVVRNVDYFTMGHLSKFVQPGAFRVDSNTFDDDLENVAFQNPDGSRVMVVSNRTAESKTMRVNEGGQAFEYTLPGEAAVTFKWGGGPEKKG